jgi:hypothetical protein
MTFNPKDTTKGTTTGTTTGTTQGTTQQQKINQQQKGNLGNLGQQQKGNLGQQPGKTQQDWTKMGNKDKSKTTK